MSRLSASNELITPGLPLSSPNLSRPALPGWLLAIPGVKRIVNRIGATEFRRRLFHMTPALLPAVLPIVPHPDVWGPTLMTIVVVSSVIVLAIAFFLGPLMTRRGEQDWMGAVLGYMVPVLAPILLLRGQAELGLMTLQILALGDGSATFGGKMFGGRRLPWNRNKTFAGLFCFAIAGSLAATYSFWGEIRPGISLGTAFLICGTAAVCAAIVESLPIRSNDNLRVGTTALVIGTIMSAILL